MWTLNTFGAIKELESGLKRYDLDLVPFQEIRWPGVGVKECEERYILYSGRDDDEREEGTGFYIRKNLYSNVIHFGAVNSRLSKLRLRCTWFNLSLLCVHAYTEVSEDEAKNLWYS